MHCDWDLFFLQKVEKKNYSKQKQTPYFFEVFFLLWWIWTFDMRSDEVVDNIKRDYSPIKYKKYII